MYVNSVTLQLTSSQYSTAGADIDYKIPILWCWWLHLEILLFKTMYKNAWKFPQCYVWKNNSSRGLSQWSTMPSLLKYPESRRFRWNLPSPIRSLNAHYHYWRSLGQSCNQKHRVKIVLTEYATEHQFHWTMLVTMSWTLN